ncbi:prolyl oligopeptidase family serine peptidase [Metabacillus arenae]|uniref:Prolyl oligopeptidase family serine peptidase n=1 Tax=Metabacillus arenae TaxID=2771434 RepID=A0A926NIE0_9BACI|nr:prolyl oligopeptidase family serine peptidase [Metabacillus arenae]MBD1380573.1 prolyl oligopeptidase family serine peptidase [Metabacillus arenae]
MVIVEHLNVSQIPLLHVVKDELKNEKTPFILFIHGFTSAKEHNLHYAYLLAEEGFRVVLPEAIYHGEREENMSLIMNLNVNFWKIVINEIQELNIIKQYFDEQQLIDPDRIGAAGTSMGGITTLGALTQYDWIKTAVSLMGSPYYEGFLRNQLDYMKNKGLILPITEEEIEKQIEHLRMFDLSLHREKLSGRPLLFWHGKKDPVVPFQPTYQFFQEIKPDYEQTPELLKFIVDEQADHKVSREGLKETIAWFTAYL